MSNFGKFLIYLIVGPLVIGPIIGILIGEFGKCLAYSVFLSLLFSVACLEGLAGSNNTSSNADKYNSLTESARYNTDLATGAQIAMLKNINDKLNK